MGAPTEVSVGLEEGAARWRREGSGETVYPAEEICSREVMRTAGRQPRILLTNVKQLELLLTRQQDVELFADARLDLLVFDEAHTFTGALGAEAACLVRRLRAFCGADPDRTTCVATSATIVDHDEPQAGRNFAARFFGVAADSVATVEEAYETEVRAGPRFTPPPPAGDPAALLDRAVAAVGEDTGTEPALRDAYRALAGEELGAGDWPAALHAALSRNEVVFRLNEELATPKALEALPAAVASAVGRPVTEAEILAWLTLGAAARRDGRPLLRPVVHGFVRGIGGAVVSFPRTATARGRGWRPRTNLRARPNAVNVSRSSRSPPAPSAGSTTISPSSGTSPSPGGGRRAARSMREAPAGNARKSSSAAGASCWSTP